MVSVNDVSLAQNITESIEINHFVVAANVVTVSQVGAQSGIRSVEQIIRDSCVTDVTSS